MVLQIIPKGVTPIEKNVLVIDEQGNEYEATYPKRAKGLVKKGRARFIDEHTICLACPPNEYLEENSMQNNNINKNQVFEQITALRNSMDDMSKILFQIQCVPAEQPYVETEEGEVILREFAPDIAMEKIKVIREVVMSREQTIHAMLDFYLHVYQQIEADETEA